MPISVSTFREQLEAMNADALDEYYRHSAGLKPTLEIAAIYERYPDLTALEQVQAMEAEGAPVELRQYAAEGYIGNGVKLLTDQVANTEAELSVSLGEESIPYRSVRPRLMNEPDAGRRRDLHARRCDATEQHLNPILAEIAETERGLTRDVGANTVLELYTSFGYDPVALHRSTSQLLEDTEDLYRTHMDARLRQTLGLGLDDASPADLARLWRAPEFDRGFPPERALPALRATLTALGVDLDSQSNVELDIAERPNKVPRAFCAPVRVPDRVVLVILPQGGPEDYQALFHEAGHTEHFATPRVTSRLSTGCWATTGHRGVAFLLEHLVRIGAGSVPGSTSVRSRSTCASAPSPSSSSCAGTRPSSPTRSSCTPGRRWTRCRADTAHWSPKPWACRIPPATTWRMWTGASTAPDYLRAWAFETQLRGHLRDRFGTQWHQTSGAGSLVREMWNLGQSMNADDLLQEVTGSRIDFGVLTAEAHEALDRLPRPAR